MNSRTLAWSTCGAVAVLGLYFGPGCSSSKTTPAPATPTTTALPATYKSNACDSCHGADGSTLSPGGDAGHVIKGTTLTEANFLSTIRNGETAKAGGLMAKYTASQMSDADVQQLFNYATGK